MKRKKLNQSTLTLSATQPMVTLLDTLAKSQNKTRQQISEELVSEALRQIQNPIFR